MLNGASPTGFNNAAATLEFRLTTGQFDISDAKLLVNDEPVQVATLPDLVTASNILQDGRNDMALTAYDTLGRPIWFYATLWAGSSSSTVDVRDDTGNLYLAPVVITAYLGDAPQIYQNVSTNTGTAQLSNVPDRTVVLEAQTPDQLYYGVSNIFGSSTTIVLNPFYNASSVSNNDLSLGTAEGWVYGGATPVTIIPHIDITINNTRAVRSWRT